ncbi:hypothetical protein JVU11DRAFT_1020 [Chiua virens]|nr:hypothetical protein JVU11DRAFT_1020 [Chiua virens]
MPHLPTVFLDDGTPMFPSDNASSSSSSPPSPPALRHRLRRKRSPSPTSRYTSHLYSTPAPRPYSPSSREADIARLLDPAYASPVPNSPLSKAKMVLKEVYVDHRGDFHDPDYRDFPPFVHSRQPRWERAYGDDDDDDDDDDCELVQPRSSFDQRHRQSCSVTYHSPPVYYPYEEPSSYESRYLAEDEDEEADQLERAPLKERSFYCRSGSPTKRPKAQDEKPSPTSEGDHVIQADSEWT